MSARELIERLENLDRPDRSLSRAIMTEIGGWHRITPSQGGGKHGGFIAPEDWSGRYSDGRPILDSLHGTTIYRDAPHVTASLDAAIALVEKVQPGCIWTLEPDIAVIRILTENDVDEFRGHIMGGNGKCTAIALLTALLRSLSPTEGER